MMIQNGRSKKYFLTSSLTLIFLIAIVTRLGWPGLTEFKFDEAQMYRSSVRLLRDGVVPSHVISSIPEIPYPPFMVYLLSLPLLIVRHPAAAVIFVGLLGVGAVVVTYAFGVRYYSRPVGLIAAALFATAPWAIFYSRKIWAQNVPLFTLVLMLGLYAFVIERRWWGILVAIAATLLLVGMHLGNLVFGPIVLVVLVFNWKLIPAGIKQASRRERLTTMTLSAGFVVGLLVAILPWIQVMADGDIAGRIAGLFVQSDPVGPAAFLESVHGMMTIGTSHGFSALAGNRVSDYWARLPLRSLIPFIEGVTDGLFSIGMGYVIVTALWVCLKQITGRKTASGSPDAAYVLLALWLIVPPIIWTLSGLPLQIHRYIAVYPAQFLAAAVFIVDVVNLVSARSEALRVPSYVVVGAWIFTVMVSQLTAYVVTMGLIAEGEVTYGHGPPARLNWNASREARQLALAGHLPIIVNTTGANPEENGDAAAFDALLGDLDLRIIAGETVRDRPPRESVQVDLRSDATYEVRLRDPFIVEPDAIPTTLANGVEFLYVEPSGIAAQIAPGANVPYSVVWRIWGIPPSPNDYSYSVQVFDAGWLRRVNINDHFLRTRYWHEGDFVITSGMLRLPDDLPPQRPVHLVLTLYTILPDGSIQPVTVLDAAMNPAGEFIDLALP